MKDQTNIWECRDISGTVCIPIAYLDYLMGTLLFAYLACFIISLWPLIPTGSFFNNWLSIIHFLPVGFFIASTKNKKIN